MKKSTKMFAGLAIVSGLASPIFAADAITFDPDGAGGDAAITNVLSFDWTPGNVLAVGGNAAVANFIATATGTPSGANSVNFDVDADTVQTPYSVYYQAKLGSFARSNGAGGSSPFTPAGLNTAYEITAVARFEERVEFVRVNNATGAVSVEFSIVPSTTQYLEIYFGSVLAGTLNADDLTGTGFNDGVRILEASILTDGFISGYTATRNAALPGAAATQVFDQADVDNYGGLRTVVGSGDVLFQSDIESFDSSFFIDVLSEIGFSASTNGNLKLPFAEVEPGASFLIDDAGTGTALGVVPVAAGAGNRFDPILGVGTVNGGTLLDGGTVGNSIQFQADVNTSFTRVPGVVPEPATAALGIMALAGLALRGRRNRMA